MMARQLSYKYMGVYPVAVLLILVVATLVEGHPGHKDQPNRKYQSNATRNLSRITGGVDTTISEYPSQVAIFHNGSFVCGGTLVGKKRQHVLTAARCVTLFRGRVLDRRLFYVALNSSSAVPLDSGARTRNLSRIVIHPSFNSTGYANADIAILTFDKPIYANMSPARLEQADNFVLQDYAGKTGVTVGWGSTQQLVADKPSPPNQISTQLKKIDLPILSYSDCRELLKLRIPSNPADITFGGGVICTQAKTSVGPCLRDVGGPLFVNGIQIGIIKRTFGCGDSRYPVMYTRVAYHRDWIDEQIFK